MMKKKKMPQTIPAPITHRPAQPQGCGANVHREASVHNKGIAKEPIKIRKCNVKLREKKKYLPLGGQSVASALQSATLLRILETPRAERWILASHYRVHI